MVQIVKYTGSKQTLDVPVRINIWIRPDCQKQQWEIIKKVKPSIIFLQSDGGRNDKEWKSIKANRSLIDNSIDWDCQVFRFYEDSNNGLYQMGKKVSSFIWSKVDRCIFLEDDQLPSISFFRYCKELLEKYKDDERIECICGMNHLGKWNCASDYFFSRQGSIWGTATWRRVFENRKKGFAYNDDKYVMGLLKQRTKHNRIAWKRLNAYANCDYFEGHVPGTEFWREFDMYSQNRLQIIPKVNMIKNVGFGKDSAHAKDLLLMPKSIKKIFNMQTYEIEFPMKHADYVIPDIKYEKKRNKIMHYNECFVTRTTGRIGYAIKLLFLNPKLLFSKFKKKDFEH